MPSFLLFLELRITALGYSLLPMPQSSPTVADLPGYLVVLAMRPRLSLKPRHTGTRRLRLGLAIAG